MINEIFVVFQEYSPLITAIAMVVIGVATTVYALHNKKMADRIRVQTKPILNLYHDSKLSFILENIGMISAKNIILTPRIELKGELLEVGKLNIEELNSKEKTSIQLYDRILSKLKEKDLVNKRKARELEAVVDPLTEMEDVVEFEVEDWEISKSHFDFTIKFGLIYKSDSGDSYSSNRTFSIELFPIFIHPAEDHDQSQERIRFHVSAIQGIWKD